LHLQIKIYRGRKRICRPRKRIYGVRKAMCRLQIKIYSIRKRYYIDRSNLTTLRGYITSIGRHLIKP
jgi:hypothetical protein